MGPHSVASTAQDLKTRQDLDLLLRNIARNPLASARLVQGDNDAVRKNIINLPSWTNKAVFHGLGYVPNGWFIVWHDASFFQTPQQISMTDKYITLLNVTSTMNIKMVVF